jgi:hypothetical protein
MFVVALSRAYLIFEQWLALYFIAVMSCRRMFSLLSPASKPREPSSSLIGAQLASRCVPSPAFDKLD